MSDKGWKAKLSNLSGIFDSRDIVSDTICIKIYVTYYTSC